MKKYLLFLFLSMPEVVFAAAGFADRYHDHQKWFFSGYKYWMILGLVSMLVLLCATLSCKTKTREITTTISHYLVKHPTLAIMFSGIILAIPMGIISSVLWEIIWFLSVYPFMGMRLAFPFVLINKRLRENWLLSRFWIKWGIIVSLSSIMASLLFIVIINNNIIQITEFPHFYEMDQANGKPYLPTHPYDSMREIWNMPLYFIVEIFIAIAFYYLGVMKRYLSRKISGLQHRKIHKSQIDIE